MAAESCSGIGRSICTFSEAAVVSFRKLGMLLAYKLCFVATLHGRYEEVERK